MPPSTVASGTTKLPDIKGKKGKDSPDCHGHRPPSRTSRASEVSWGSSDTTMSECVCTICNCGKHACPMHKWKPTEFGGNSRYREDYPQHPLAMNRRAPPGQGAHVTPSTPDHFKSKYDEDFQAFNSQRAKSLKPKENTIETVPFTATTTNQQMFTPKQLGPRTSKKPPTPTKERLPFDGTTTNRDNFRAYDGVKPRESMAPQQHMLPSAAFDGTSAYKEDYPAHDAVGNRRKPPAHGAYEYGPARNLGTEQRAAFTEKPLDLCPALFLPKKDPSEKTGHIHYTKRGTTGMPFSATFDP